MARPRKEIDQKLFEHLCATFNTLEDISYILEVSEDTIERWCKRTYGEGFADIYKKKSAKGRASLRKSQFEMARKNTTMAIWMGKQYLGQKDQVEATGAQITEETRKAIAGLIDAVDKGNGNNSINE